MNSSFKTRIIIAAVIALFALVKYYSSTSVNEITGEKQHISMTVEQEISLGLNSAPQMAAEFGGLSRNMQARRLVDSIGQSLATLSEASKTGYHFDYHVLADPRTINAFALPGGQIFITEGLLSQLQNIDQLAGVLGHETGHVVARHSAQQMAKQQLTQGIASAAGVAGGGYNSAYYAQVVANMVNLKYGRNDELQADELGVRFMMETGYDPEQMIGVMDILENASSGSNVPEFESTHPSPENRRIKIRESIDKYRAQGLGQSK